MIKVWLIDRDYQEYGRQSRQVMYVNWKQDDQTLILFLWRYAYWTWLFSYPYVFDDNISIRFYLNICLLKCNENITHHT